MSRSVEDGIVAHHQDTASNLFTLVVISLVIVVASISCLTRNVAAPRASLPAAQTADSFSLFDLGGTWKDQSGISRTLRSTSTGPMVLAFVYTDCTAVCPLIVTTMQRIETQSDAAVRFVLVTLNPSHDTPATLKHFADAHGLSSRWTLLNGSDLSVRELAVALGVRYARVSPMDLSHSNTFAVVDSNGSIAAQFTGTDVVDRATTLLASLSRNVTP